MQRVLLKDAMIAEPGQIFVKGRVCDVRKLGGLKFVVLGDQSGTIQIVMPKKKVTPEVFGIDYMQGDILAISGELVANKTAPGGKEILPKDVTVLSKTTDVYPISLEGETQASLDLRLDWRFLDLRAKTTAAIFEIQSEAAYAFQQFFSDNGFTQFFSSKIVGAATESGASVFEIEYFGQKAFLAQSPQFYKQMMISGGFEKVFEVGPVFRAEKFATVRHLCEYTSVDFEQAYINDETDVMVTLQDAIRYVLKRLKDKKEDAFKALEVELAMPPSKFPVLDMEEAHEILKQNDKVLEKGDDLDPEAEKIIGKWGIEEQDSDFVFVNSYPWQVRPFYTMRRDGSECDTKSFDLLYKGQELTTGGQREHRLDVLTAQAKEKGAEPEELKSYLDFFRYGIPPHGGSGTGIERFVQQLLGMFNIRETRLLPRDPKRISP